MYRVVVILVLLLGVTINTSAQTIPFAVDSDRIVLEPAYPKPGQAVEATLESFGTNLAGSALTWRLNGEMIADATNRREARFVAGDLGETDILEVAVTTPEGLNRTIRQEIYPVYLDIVVEPQTHVPDFYQGRALPSVGSTVNVAALVNAGVTLNPRDLVYTWRLNQQVLESGPLRGGDTISFETPSGRDMILSLQVSTPTGVVVAARSIVVPIVRPELHFYERNSLYGMKPQSITDTLYMLGNTVTIHAEPYYLDSRVFNSPAIIEWLIDGTENTPSNNPYSVTLQKTGTVGGSTLGFEVRDTTQLLQGTRGTMRITY